VLHRLKSGKRDNLFSSRFVQQGRVLSHLLKFRHISIIFERNSGGRYAQNGSVAFIDAIEPFIIIILNLFLNIFRQLQQSIKQ
jgi:hypothetical protein